QVLPWTTLQRYDLTGLEERTLRQYEEVYDAYFEQRGLIPAGRLHEMRFEDLEADPLGQLRQLYKALQLGDFSPAEPAVSKYLGAIANYQKNRYHELDSPWRDEVSRRWRRSFEEWGYA